MRRFGNTVDVALYLKSEELGLCLTSATHLLLDQNFISHLNNLDLKDLRLLLLLLLSVK